MYFHFNHKLSASLGMLEQTTLKFVETSKSFSQMIENFCQKLQISVLFLLIFCHFLCLSLCKSSLIRNIYFLTFPLQTHFISSSFFFFLVFDTLSLCCSCLKFVFNNKSCRKMCGQNLLQKLEWDSWQQIERRPTRTRHDPA